MLKDVAGSFQNGLLAMAGIMLAATPLAASLKAGHDAGVGGGPRRVAASICRHCAAI